MLNTSPNLYTLEGLLRACDGTVQACVDGKWVPARPYGFYSFRHRVKCTWMVFTGRADAVTWPGDQMPKAY